MNYRVRFLLLLMLLLPGAAVPAADPLTLTGADRSRPYQIVSDEVEFFEDSTRTRTLAQILALPRDTFQPLRHSCCNLGTESEPVWLRFRVLNQTRFDSTFYIEVVNPFISHLTLYQLDARDSLLQSDATGAERPFLQRPVPHRNFLFKGYAPAGSTTWFYLEIKTDYPLFLRILLWDYKDRLATQQRIEDILLTGFYVFCFFYLLLSVIGISVTRQYYQWYYLLYVAVTTVFIAAHLGLGYRYIWPNQPILQFIVPVALNILRLVFGIEFFRRYYDLAGRSRRFNRIIDITIGFFILTALLMVFQYWIPRPFLSKILGSFFGYLMLLSALMLGWVIYQVLYERRRRASWLFLVITLHFIGLTCTSLQYLGYGTFDPAAPLVPFGERTSTFFVQATVIAAFFVEMTLVFYFSIRRYIRLYEKGQRAQIRLGRVKEEGYNALLLGVENERRRIARDLHDGACVSLAAIRMKVDALSERLPDAELAAIAGDLESTYREVRGISHDLMSSALERTGLLPALEELIGRVQQAQPGLSVQLYVNFNLEGIGGLARINLYRIVQELLGNVLKHARASSVDVQLLQDEGQLLLSVEDNGRGFDPAQAGRNGGIGLANIRTRVSVLHGALHLDSMPGKGTFVSIAIPESAIRAEGRIS